MVTAGGNVTSFLERCRNRGAGDQNRRGRWGVLMKKGITCFSFYTGKLTGPFCMHKICRKELLDEFGFEYCSVPIATQAGTDNDSVCQMLMMRALRIDEKDACHSVLKHAFPSMESHMTAYGKELAVMLTPPSDASNEEKVTAYKLMLETFIDSSDEVFQGGRPTAPCLIHKCQCPVFDTLVGMPPLQWFKPVLPIDLTSDSQDSQAVNGELRPKSSGSGDSSIGMPATKLCDEPRHVHFEMGNTCTDFAGYGDHKGQGGLANKPLAVLAAELLAVEPDTFTQEWVCPNTEGVFASLVCAKYDTVEVEVNPPSQGKPMKRPRRLTSGWRRGRKQFHGAVDEYNSLLSTTLQCSGEVFFRPEYDCRRRSEALERARLNGFCFADSCVSPEAHHMFKFGTVEILQGHQAVRSQLQGPDGSYIVDLEQHAKFSKGGNCVPTLVTHGTVASLTETNKPPKIMVPEEHMLCQGEPLFNGAEMKSFIGHLLDGLSPVDIKRLAGNAFETNTFGSWNLYFLANISDASSQTCDSEIIDTLIDDDSSESKVLTSPPPLDDLDDLRQSFD